MIFSTDVDIITNRVTTSTTTARVTETETDLPSELQDCLGGGGDVAVRPGQEVELSHGPRLPGLVVLQVERPHQVVLAPDVLRHQVDLEHQHECVCVAIATSQTSNTDRPRNNNWLSVLRVVVFTREIS